MLYNFYFILEIIHEFWHCRSSHKAVDLLSSPNWHTQVEKNTEMPKLFNQGFWTCFFHIISIKWVSLAVFLTSFMGKDSCFIKTQIYPVKLLIRFENSPPLIWSTMGGERPPLLPVAVLTLTLLLALSLSADFTHLPDSSNHLFPSNLSDDFSLVYFQKN